MGQPKRERTGGIKFELLVQFLSTSFLQYLSEDVERVSRAFDLSPNACNKLHEEVVKEVEKLGLPPRPTIKKIFGKI